MRLPNRAAVVAAVVGAVLITGCASQPQNVAPQTASEAIFIPPPPHPPRLQFLTSFSSADPWIGTAQKKKSSLANFVAGEEKLDSSETQFGSPYGMEIHDGVMYICDVGLDKVHIVDIPRKQYRTLKAPFKIENPVNLAIDADGTKYVVDSGRRTLLVFDGSDQFIREIGNPQDWTPLDVALHGDELLVTDIIGGEIEVWSKDGQFLRMISSKGDGPDQLVNPSNLAIDGELVFVSDLLQQTVKVFSLDGKFQSMIGSSGSNLGRFGKPKGVTVDPEGHVYVADSQFDAVQVFETSGQLLLVFGKPGPEPDAMGMPAGLAIDQSSLEHFQQFADPSFKMSYLLFVVNQFGQNKIAVYGFGRSTRFSEEDYEVKPLPPKEPATQPAAPVAGSVP